MAHTNDHGPVQANISLTQRKALAVETSVLRGFLARRLRSRPPSQNSFPETALAAKRVVLGPIPPATHNTCSARMSADPREGIANVWSQTHDIRNLFISDG